LSTPTEKWNGEEEMSGAVHYDNLKRSGGARIVDLRSDTVTQPTEQMRKAMAAAVVGNDDYDEDPTVNRLQEMAAQLTGKQAALLVSSGTMANLIALTVLGRDGVTLVGEHAHIYYWEGRAVRTVTKTRLCAFDDGSGPSVEAVAAAFNKTEATLVALENSVARLCGKVISSEAIRRISDTAHAKGASVHVDGARLFNATTALGVSPADLLAPVDTATFCLSKGLGAPYGSLLVGSTEFVQAAKDVRWLLGGGLKQVGIMAAAGIVAMETMIDRLAEDHRNAALLYDVLGDIEGVDLPWGRPESNMVFFTVDAEQYDKSAVVKALAERNVLVRNSTSKGTIRCVTHKDVAEEDIYLVGRTLREVLGTLKRKQ